MMETKISVEPLLKGEGISSGELSGIAPDSNALALVVADLVGEQRQRGFGYQLRMDALRSVREKDPEVNRILLALWETINGSASELKRELESHDSNSGKVYRGYLEWAAHRPEKKAEEDSAKQEELRAIEPALMRTRVSAIIDLIVLELVNRKIAVPETLTLPLEQETTRNWKEQLRRIRVPGTERKAEIEEVAAAHGGSVSSEGSSLIIQLNGDAYFELLKKSLLKEAKIEIPVAECFQFLFQGGAERIQARADLWMLNDRIGQIYDTERALISGGKIANEELFKAVWILNDLDGGSPIGFQKPLTDGSKRVVFEDGSSSLPAKVGSLELVKKGDSALARAHSNILQQSGHATRAVQAIEKRLMEGSLSDPDHVGVLDLYHTYSSALLYNSQKIWANFGVPDRLIEASAVVGTQEHREAALSFLYQGTDQIRSLLHQEFRSPNITCRDIYLAILKSGIRTANDGPTIPVAKQLFV